MTDKKAIQYMRDKNIIWKFDGTMFMNGKKLSKFMTGYHAKQIKSLMKTKSN